MLSLIIAICTFAGLGLLFGILIADMRAGAAHQRWLEESNKRRHGIKS